MQKILKRQTLKSLRKTRNVLQKMYYYVIIVQKFAIKVIKQKIRKINDCYTKYHAEVWFYFLYNSKKDYINYGHNEKR